MNSAMKLAKCRHQNCLLDPDNQNWVTCPKCGFHGLLETAAKHILHNCPHSNTDAFESLGFTYEQCLDCRAFRVLAREAGPAADLYDALLPGRWDETSGKWESGGGPVDLIAHAALEGR